TARPLYAPRHGAAAPVTASRICSAVECLCFGAAAPAHYLAEPLGRSTLPATAPQRLSPLRGFAQLSSVCALAQQRPLITSLNRSAALRSPPRRRSACHRFADLLSCRVFVL